MFRSAIRRSGPTCMWNVVNGAWLGMSARSGTIRPSWSRFNALLPVNPTHFISLNSELRKRAPNSMISRELDQIATTMK